MKYPCRSSKSSSPLSDLDSRLSIYALAASAAGAGMLALAQPAEGRIVYTKAHRQIVPNTTLKLDLNHDGTADFSFKDTFSHSFYSSFGRLFAIPLDQNNQVRGHSVGTRAYASALFSGDRIGPKGRFLPASGLMVETSFLGGVRHDLQGSCSGPWANVTGRYLGLKFVISGKMHFGWARLNARCAQGSQVFGLLTGYAYETVPNRQIVTGVKRAAKGERYVNRENNSQGGIGSLGRLARGGSGPSKRVAQP